VSGGCRRPSWCQSKSMNQAISGPYQPGGTAGKTAVCWFLANEPRVSNSDPQKLAIFNSKIQSMLLPMTPSRTASRLQVLCSHLAHTVAADLTSLGGHPSLMPSETCCLSCKMLVQHSMLLATVALDSPGTLRTPPLSWQRLRVLGLALLSCSVACGMGSCTCYC